MNTQSEVRDLSYLVLPRLEFRGANGQPAWWCTGSPGPMAACGFVHAMMLSAGGAEHAAKVRGVGLVIHDYAMRMETLRDSRGFEIMCPHQLRGASWVNDRDYAGEGDTLASQPTVRGDGIASIVVAIERGAPSMAREIAAFLRRARFAGGDVASHLFDPARPIRIDTADEVVGKVRTGFAFHDRADLLVSIADDRDPLDAFLRITRRPRPVAAEQAKDRERNASASAPWLMPYLAGLRALTRIEPRPMSRDAHQHAFAEPLVGLGQLVSLRQNKRIPLWSYATADHHAFTVQPER